MIKRLTVRDMRLGLVMIKMAFYLELLILIHQSAAQSSKWTHFLNIVPKLIELSLRCGIESVLLVSILYRTTLGISLDLL